MLYFKNKALIVSKVNRKASIDNKRTTYCQWRLKSTRFFIPYKTLLQNIALYQLQ